MGIFDIFAKKSDPVIMPETEETEKKRISRETQREQAQFLREKMRVELDTERLRNEQIRQQMQAEIEERRLDIEIRKLQKEKQLNDLRDSMADDDEDDDGVDPADDMFGGLIAAVLKHTHNPGASSTAAPGPTHPSVSPTTPAQGVVLSDDDIRAKWSLVPNSQKALARALPDEKLREHLIQMQPDISQQSLQRAIQIIRSE